MQSNSRNAAQTNKTIRPLAAVALGAGLALTGCASGLGSRDYERAEVGQVNRVEEGVIVAAEPVTIEGGSGALGAATGAVIGGIAGAQIGGDDASNAVGGVIGAVGGGIAGREIDKRANTKPGFRYTVRLRNSGDLVTIVQGGDIAMSNGTAVYVQYGDRARVIPQNANLSY